MGGPVDGESNTVRTIRRLIMREKSVELLNQSIADELYAVHQYMYFHFYCDDLGLDLLAGLFKKTAIEEMLHIERMAERVLFLKGDVALKAAQEVKQIHEPKEMLEIGAQIEEKSIEDYNRFANECAKNNDSNTKKLFEDIINDEERHFDQYDTELENLKKFGQNYLALQSIERSKTIFAGGQTEGN